MPNNLTRAIELSKFVLKWHEHYGVHLITTEPRERYLLTLNQLQRLDPNSHQTARKIASEQCSGVFECFYGIEIPEWFFHIELGALDIYPELYSSTSPHQPSRMLGEIGRLIDELLSTPEDDTHQSVPLFNLPINWQREFIYLEPAKILLTKTLEGKKREVLRNFFADLANLEKLGLGGKELMVSMNEDIKEQNEDSLFVYSPASFDFQFSIGEGTIVGLLVDQQITIDDVTLGCSDNYGTLLE